MIITIENTTATPIIINDVNITVGAGLSVNLTVGMSPSEYANDFFTNSTDLQDLIDSGDVLLFVDGVKVTAVSPLKHGSEFSLFGFGDLTDVLWTTNRNNVALVPNGWRIDLSANQNLTGIAGGSHGDVRKLFNVSDNNLTILNDSGNSLVANRFATPNNVNFTLQKNQSVSIRYDQQLRGGSGAWHIF